MFKQLWKRRTKSCHRAHVPHSFKPRLEGLEDRVVPAAVIDTTDNWWVAAPAQSAAWEVDTNWSLLHAPTNTENARFDAAHSLVACVLGAGRVAAPASVQVSGDWTSTVTVNGNISTPNLTLNARNAGGQEIIIASGGQVEVTDTMTFGGGNVSGSGTLLMDNGGRLTVTGTSAADRPTLGCALQLGSSDGSTTGSMQFGPNSAVQPLVVTGKASITVNEGNINFNGTPLAGNTSVTAISNGDAGTETITVNTRGLVNSVGFYEQIVGMGVVNNGGQVISGDNVDVAPLHFTGQTWIGFGLLSAGYITVNGSMAFDYGASILGGTVQELNSNSQLTLGLAASSGASGMSGGTINLPGTLVAHGGFNMSGGSLYTTGSIASTIRVDSGTSFSMSGGFVFVTETIPGPPAQVSGQLTIAGNFVGTGGSLVVTVCSQNGNFTNGLFMVNGNMTLNTGFTFRFYDVADNPQGPHTWNPIRWTGTRTGTATINVPNQNWTAIWDDTNKWLVVNEP